MRVVPRFGTRALIGMNDARYHEPHSRVGHLIGIRPVDVIDRTETNFIKIFFIWFSANMNLLS